MKYKVGDTLISKGSKNKYYILDIETTHYTPMYKLHEDDMSLLYTEDDLKHYFVKINNDVIKLKKFIKG